ncbi:hypothetical protein ZIOFF_055223 [Zingiber officinale]|uniref:Uncharacterized protein n=1 Tax=Zingiber officinale TaxID=94328 RepID=A0A8J5FB78_ZINOF|nr:hypothetical protein ZIOFF_055223 [Zingiber officinale]
MPRFPKRPHPYPLSPSLLLSLPSLPSRGLLHLLGFLLLMLFGFSVDSSAAFSPEIVLIPLLFLLLVLGFGSSGLLLRRLHSWRLSSNAEIDLRILKAVALEHPNDIDAAAESILVEILPSIATSHESSFALQDANEVVRVSTSDGKGKQPMFYEHQEEEQTSNHLSGNVWENTVSSHGPTSASANTSSSYSKRYLLVLIE